MHAPERRKRALTKSGLGLIGSAPFVLLLPGGWWRGGEGVGKEFLGWNVHWDPRTLSL